MKSIVLFSVFGLISLEAYAQEYIKTGQMNFAARISNGEPRMKVAGGDHAFRHHKSNELALSLTGDAGRVVIGDQAYPLSHSERNKLRLGLMVVVGEEYLLTLSSDTANRSKALLIVQSATDTQKAIHYIINLRIKPTKKKN